MKRNDPKFFEEIPMSDLPPGQPLGLLRMPDDSIAPRFLQRVAALANDPCEREIKRMMRDGVSREDAEEARLDFLRFMSLVNICWDMPVVPSKRADSFWHIAILFTKEYADFCNRHFGKFIHHRPGKEDIADAAFERSSHLARRLYDIAWVDRGECGSCDHCRDPGVCAT